MNTPLLYDHAVKLLQQLIGIPSFSKEENGTADAIIGFFSQMNVVHERHLNNVWVKNRHFDPAKPTILLNSHHDTVRPNPNYTRDPFLPVIENGKLFGLGSNDAGGCLVALAATFLYFYEEKELNYNIIFAATAEEEISGKNGIEAVLTQLPAIAFAIVGEPTKMDLAIAEKGLMVLDCIAHGKAGHAARDEGVNALYKAMKDIEWFRDHKFQRTSEWLGEVKMTVTEIHTENKAHNVVPSTCNFTVDIRITDAYTHEEVLEQIKQQVECEVIPRSLRMRSTRIDVEHPLVRSAMAIGKMPYGSPTSSDKALMPFPALKCGPGDSARSHTADEYIFLEEIRNGIDDYINILQPLMITKA